MKTTQFKRTIQSRRTMNPCPGRARSNPFTPQLKYGRRYGGIPAADMDLVGQSGVQRVKPGWNCSYAADGSLNWDVPCSYCLPMPGPNSPGSWHCVRDNSGNAPPGSPRMRSNPQLRSRYGGTPMNNSRKPYAIWPFAPRTIYPF